MGSLLNRVGSLLNRVGLLGLELLSQWEVNRTTQIIFVNILNCIFLFVFGC